MRVYRVGTEYCDLDHIVSIGEPYLSNNSCEYCVCIPVQFKFVSGNNKIILPLARMDTSHWVKDWKEAQEYISKSTRPDGEDYEEVSHKVSSEVEEKHDAERSTFNNAEFLRIKYNVWKPFLAAWMEGKQSSLETLQEVANNLK